MAFGPAKDLHITGTIFFLPVTVFVMTCCFRGSLAWPAAPLVADYCAIVFAVS